MARATVASLAQPGGMTWGGGFLARGQRGCRPRDPFSTPFVLPVLAPSCAACVAHPRSYEEIHGLRELFKSFDRNGDGQITLDELREGLARQARDAGGACSRGAQGRKRRGPAGVQLCRAGARPRAAREGALGRGPPLPSCPHPPCDACCRGPPALLAAAPLRRLLPRPPPLLAPVCCACCRGPAHACLPPPPPPPLLTSRLLRLQARLADSEVEQILRDTDVDGNGVIDYEEFVARWG